MVIMFPRAGVRASGARRSARPCRPVRPPGRTDPLVSSGPPGPPHPAHSTCPEASRPPGASASSCLTRTARPSTLPAKATTSGEPHREHSSEQCAREKERRWLAVSGRRQEIIRGDGRCAPLNVPLAEGCVGVLEGEWNGQCKPWFHPHSGSQLIGRLLLLSRVRRRRRRRRRGVEEGCRQRAFEVSHNQHHS